MKVPSPLPGSARIQDLVVPDAHFFGDEVVLLCDFGPRLDPSTDPPSWPRYRKIVIRPVSWLYGHGTN